MSNVSVETVSFDDLTPEEKKKATTNLIEKMHETVMMFAEALNEYGQHLDGCNIEMLEDCSCGFHEVRGIAKHMIELDDHLNGKTVAN